MPTLIDNDLGIEAERNSILWGSVGNLGKMAEGYSSSAIQTEILAQFQVAMIVVFLCLVKM